MKLKNGTVKAHNRRSLAKIVCSLSAIAVCSKFFGFAEKVVIANYFGTGESADVYFASMTVVLSVVFLMKELVYPALLPVFAHSLTKPSGVSVVLLRKSLLCGACFLVVVAVLLAVFPGVVTSILLPGFSDSKRQMTCGLLRSVSPAVFFLGLTTVTYTVLNAGRRFLQAAWPEAAAKLLIVVGLIVLLPMLGLYALAVVLGVGAFFCLLIQLLFIGERQCLFKHPLPPDPDNHFTKVLILMGPLVVGVVFSHISGIVDNMLASTLPKGQLSCLGYSRKIIDAILLIGPVALTTVVYSQLCHLASAGNRQEFTYLVGRAFRLLIYFTVPAACTLIVLKEPIIRLLFERGAFTAVSTAATAQSFMVYAFGLATLSIEMLLVQSFFALSDTKTPVKWGVVCVLLDIVLAIILLRPLASFGIACAFVVSKTVKIAILAVLLHRRLGSLFDFTIITFLVKMTLSTICVWSVLQFLSAINTGDSFLAAAVLDLIMPAAGALVTFVVSSGLLKIGEFNILVSLVKRRRTVVQELVGESK